MSADLTMSTIETTPPPADFVEKAPLERYVAADEAVAGRADARRARRRAGRHRRAGGAAQDARAADLALDLCARRDPLRPDDQRVEGPARHARRALHAGAARGRRRAGLGRRHAQMADAAAGRARRRAAARGRVRLHPGNRPRHALPVEPGRLHAHLHVLPHRHAAAGAQPHAGRDRRPGDGRARPARRLARHGARAGPGPADRRRPLRLQHRDDGHGRAALQFRGGARRHRRDRGRRGPEHLQAPHHALDLRRGADDRARRRGDRLDAGGLAARRARRAAQRAGAAQPQISDRGTARRLPQLSRPVQRAAHHLRIRDAQGRQRLAGRRARRW